eukprot:5286853-Amphidinium_carterae.1
MRSYSKLPRRPSCHRKVRAVKPLPCVARAEGGLVQFVHVCNTVILAPVLQARLTRRVDFMTGASVGSGGEPRAGHELAQGQAHACQFCVE